KHLTFEEHKVQPKARLENGFQVWVAMENGRSCIFESPTMRQFRQDVRWDTALSRFGEQQRAENLLGPLTVILKAGNIVKIAFGWRQACLEISQTGEHRAEVEIGHHLAVDPDKAAVFSLHRLPPSAEKTPVSHKTRRGLSLRLCEHAVKTAGVQIRAM